MKVNIVYRPSTRIQQLIDWFRSILTEWNTPYTQLRVVSKHNAWANATRKPCAGCGQQVMHTPSGQAHYRHQRVCSQRLVKEYEDVCCE